jgi:peptidoglycan hydrolase-like protein with peptidoglycan-binding domain
MNDETQAAVREFQKNSNLSVTGQLDQETLNSLGVSK